MFPARSAPRTLPPERPLRAPSPFVSPTYRTVMSGFASYPSLRDRAVFISGGGSGIGATMVEHFAQQGAKVGFVDIDEGASQALSAKLGAAGCPAPLFLKCDVRDIPAYQKAIEI